MIILRRIVDDRHDVKLAIFVAVGSLEGTAFATLGVKEDGGALRVERRRECQRRRPPRRDRSAVSAVPERRMRQLICAQPAFVRDAPSNTRTFVTLTAGFTEGLRLRNDLSLAHRDCRLLTPLMALRRRDCDLGSRRRMKLARLEIEHRRDGCANYTSRESWNERCQQPFARGTRVRLGCFALKVDAGPCGHQRMLAASPAE